MSEKVMETENCTGEKIPKRIIHFSDGAVPEYSSEEEDNGTIAPVVVNIDLASLGWIEWLRFKSSEWGTNALNICDYLGDSLSSFFGITTPKYQFEIDHFNMMKKLESEVADSEMGTINTSSEKKENLV